MKDREALFAKINRAAVPLYLAVNLGLGVWNCLLQRWYYGILALCALALPFLLLLFYKAARCRRSSQLDFVVYTFAFLLYTLGLVLRWYALVPLYDKFAHTLSGVVTALFALLLFSLLSPEKSMEAARFPLAAAFVFFAVVGVAGLWELGEFGISAVFGSDPQNVLTTGVSDTMLDMLVCTVGGLAVLPSLYRYMKGGKPSLLLSIFHTVTAGEKPPR